MLTIFQALILGLLQGFSELFPISSLGHSVILPSLIGWKIRQGDDFFVTFLVATHIATAAVLFWFFRKDWALIIKCVLKTFKDRRISGEYGKLGWLLVVGTVPAGVIGIAFQDSIRGFFASAKPAAFFLMLNGVLLYGAEILRRKAQFYEDKNNPDKNLAKLSWRQAFFVGIIQILALIAGFSRSGATMAGGLLAGLSNEDAARYSFLLATPIIAGAGILKLPDLFLPQYHDLLIPFLIGGAAAALTAYFSVKFLLKFFETNKLTPFAVYCFAMGLLLTLYFLKH